MATDASIPATTAVAVTVNEPLAPDPQPVDDQSADPGMLHTDALLARIADAQEDSVVLLRHILAALTGESSDIDPAERLSDDSHLG